MQPSAAPLTPEQLRLAWNFFRRPASWPDTLEELLEAERRAALFRRFAATFISEREAAHLPLHVPAAAPATPAAPVTQRAPLPFKPHGPRFDARKAAANDLDD